MLCVHGMTGAATNWTDLMAELAPDFDCAAVDLPGSGYSPPPAKRSGYSVRALAATVIRLIEALGRGPVHLVGNSMGGAVSIRVAAARPDLVKTLTLISPVLPDRRPHRSTAHFPILTLPFVGAAAGAPLGQGAGREPGGRRVQHVLLRPGRRCTPTGSRRRWPRCAGATSSGYGAATLVGAARTLVGETLAPAAALAMAGGRASRGADAGALRQPRPAGEPGAGRPGRARLQERPG